MTEEGGTVGRVLSVVVGKRFLGLGTGLTFVGSGTGCSTDMMSSFGFPQFINRSGLVKSSSKPRIW